MRIKCSRFPKFFVFAKKNVMEDFIISVSENKKVKIERENLRHGEKEDVFYIPTESFLESEKLKYKDFLFSYDFVVKEKWKKQKKFEKYRILTREEWKYIFSSINREKQNFAHVIINGINGFVLMPDGTDFPPHCNFLITRAMANTCDIEIWHELEKQGAIFLNGANTSFFNGYLLEEEKNKNLEINEKGDDSVIIANQERDSIEVNQMFIGTFIEPYVVPIKKGKEKYFIRLVKDIDNE